ncbi:hypothetical protein D3C71_2167060 [compost metagenome]
MQKTSVIDLMSALQASLNATKPLDSPMTLGADASVTGDVPAGRKPAAKPRARKVKEPVT